VFQDVITLHRVASAKTLLHKTSQHSDSNRLFFGVETFVGKLLIAVFIGLRAARGIW
jgi:hypothetical protein